jgi:penicillin V acylase-like amidase (Ntn superfamily)
MKRSFPALGIELRFSLALALCAITALPASACTIFVLTDTNRVLFCNNEDGPSGATRIWFVPAGAKSYGAVYVGYDNGWAQGGLNTEGLAFDWVAGYKEAWGPEPNLPIIARTERVLETCATVEQAVAFYRTHHEQSFNYAKIMLADRTGASVIIGAKDGKL